MKEKTKFYMVLFTLLFLLAGCSKEEIPIEDYVRSNPATSGMSMIMKSDTGYYYGTVSGREMELHYYDVESGQNIYLCSKPECRHDGDSFCTATNEKYHVNSAYLYGDNLYLAVVEETKEEYLYKVIRVSADGSELSEVITYMTVNKSSMVALYGGEPAIIHRGVMVLPYRLCGTADVENGVTGTYLYNLITEELTQLPEIEYTKLTTGRERFTGFGDYIYFNTRIDRTNTLSRYCITDGTIEDMELSRTYAGIYEVMDEDTIFYTWTQYRLYEYKISTKTNTQYDNVLLEVAERFPDGSPKMTKYINMSDMITDGTYLYVGEFLEFRDSGAALVGSYVREDGVTSMILPSVYVFDRERNLVASVEIFIQDLNAREYFSLSILDGVVYVKTTSAVFTCPLEEFLKGGRPTFELLYTHENVEYEKFN
ncbi:MAG: hypothetical protein IJ353_04265 [Lachnospiraceae bacterium]|nr:hypothetical protein [Lachnospiraceae bacterium]